MIRRILEHPYHVTGFVFIAVIAVGVFVLQWREESIIFCLLLYFIVILGIRLDDISGQIGAVRNKSISGYDSEDTVTDHLKEIRISLKTIEKSLSGIFAAIQSQQTVTKLSPKENETEKE